jgi:hypothetical protein
MLDSSDLKGKRIKIGWDGSAILLGALPLRLSTRRLVGVYEAETKAG